MILVLGGDLLAYMISVGKDERVPEAYKIRIGMKPMTEAEVEAKKKAKVAGAVKLTIKSPDKTTGGGPRGPDT